MENLKHQLKPLFIEAIEKAFSEVIRRDGEGGLLNMEMLFELVTVDDPRDVSNGDYACPVAFKLSKKLGKAPAQIAQAIVDNFPDDHRVGSVEFAAPGFVNLRLSAGFLQEELKVLEKGFSVERGLDGSKDTRRPVIVEYPSTNAAKPMGVHHIITTVLGSTVANLFEFMGNEVIRINHLGDWGTNFGKIIYAVETWGDQKEIHADPNNQFSKLYVKFNDEAEANPELIDEARKIFAALESGDELRTAVWKWVIHESTEDLTKLLQRLDVRIDHTMGESFYRNMTQAVVEDGIEKGLFYEGEKGALIYNMGEDQVPAMIRKGDGATLYLTRDLATIQYRVQTWHPQSIFYVVDHAQSLHFQQNFKIAKDLGYNVDGDSEHGPTHLEHISFGRMSFADRSMSTRKGNVIKLEELLDEAVKRAGKLAGERGSELNREELARLMEVVGVSSVKYAILSQDRNKDIIFDWDKIITLEGNSAAYLLYTYARAHSIVRKAGDVPLSGMPVLTEEAEIEFVRHMIKLPEVLELSMKELKPHIIATYLYKLCMEFNRFYRDVHVNSADTELQKRSRLGIVNAFMFQMKATLGILGIPVLEKM
jgi:arginyl-tRNA synthetase